MTIANEPKLLKRTAAIMLDYGLYLIFFTWLVITYGVPNDEGGYTLSNDPKGWWILVAWLVYFPVVESIKGQTLGKFILGLRVVSMNGKSISFVQAFKRHLVDVLDFFFFGIVAFITVKNTPHHQRVGDLFAGTIVVGGDDFKCSSCREQLILTPNELRNRQFVCSACNAANRI